MISISPSTKVFIHVEAVDFRNGLDGLIQITKTQIKEDPFSGAIFLFKGRRGDSIKAICYDGQGFWLFMKRLSEGRFRYWPKQTGVCYTKLLARELQVLLWNGDPSKASMKSDWKKLDD